MSQVAVPPASPFSLDALVRSRAATYAVLTGAYGLLAMSAYELFGAMSIGVTFFPPAGLTFTAFLLLPRRTWPLIAAAVVTGEVAVNLIQGQPLGWSFGWAAANLTEPLVGASVCRWLAPSLGVDRPFSFAFLVGGLIAGPFCGAAIGATVLAIADDLQWLDSFPDIWIGDALGVLVVAPLLLVWLRPVEFLNRRTRDVDTVAVAAITAAVTVVLVVAEQRPLGYAAIPLLAVPAARYGAREVATAGAVVAGVLTAATARGRGPWAALSGEGAQADLVQQQAFLLVALGSSWLLKLEVLERIKASTAAQAAAGELRAARERARDQRHLRAMHEALSDLAAAVTTAEVLEAVGRHARAAFDASGTVVVIAGEAGPLRVLAADGDWRPGLSAGDELEPGGPLPLAVAVRSGRVVFGSTPAGRGGEPAQQIAIPIQLPSRRGALGLARPASRPWSEKAQIRAMAFASLVGDALERTERFEVEHRVALTLQHAIMPGHVHAPSGTRTAARYLPAADSLEVGGDWYDVIVDDRGRRAVIVIGDVVGHSLTAAAEMGNLASASRALAFAGHSPASLIAGLDLLVTDSRGAFTTMACAELDLEERLLRYALAGHPPPLLRFPDGLVTPLDDARSTPLAVRPPEGRPEGCVPVAEGSALLFYTDGLVEHRRIPLPTRLAQLEAAFSAIDPSEPESACDALVTTMLEGHHHEDDVALLCLTVTG